MHEAREHIHRWQEEGTSIKERLNKYAKFTASNNIKASTNHLGKYTLKLIKEYHI